MKKKKTKTKTVDKRVDCFLRQTKVVGLPVQTLSNVEELPSCGSQNSGAELQVSSSYLSCEKKGQTTKVQGFTQSHLEFYTDQVS